jgi:3-oxoacyl-[acyl-carrier protein] reductase
VGGPCIGGKQVTEDYWSLKGKRVLLTGASKGLGRVCAEAFEQVGAELLLCARSADRLQTLVESFGEPAKHDVFVGDLRDPEQVGVLAERAGEFGPIDVVLHAMGGGLGMSKPLLEWGEFDALFTTNLASAAELNRLLVPAMIDRGRGNVVHVGSIAGREATGSVGYNSVKAALAAYIRTLGRELADTGVIVTGISPGGFWAPENSWHRFKDRDPELLAQVIAERQPRKKLGDASEIVPVMLFLASDQATMMAGCSVPIDGGEGVTYQ